MSKKAFLSIESNVRHSSSDRKQTYAYKNPFWLNLGRQTGVQDSTVLKVADDIIFNNKEMS